MQRILAAVATVFLFETMLPVAGYCQLSTAVMTRVFQIKAGNSMGSAFTVEVDGRQYLITAKHVVGQLKDEDVIAIRKQDMRAAKVEKVWSPLTVKVFRCDDPIDIAVLVAPTAFALRYPIGMTSDGLLLGQEVFFLGFPLGISSSGGSTNLDYPTPLAKKASFAGFARQGGATALIFDGSNNPGFSGGPIVYQGFFEKTNNPLNAGFNIAGVIRGFVPDLVHVVRPEEIGPKEDVSRLEEWRIFRSTDGRPMKLVDTDHLIPTNSNLMSGYDIRYAIDLIHKHPVGPIVTP